MNYRTSLSKVGKSDENLNIPLNYLIIVTLDSKEASWYVFLLVVFVQTKLESSETAFFEKN